MVRRNITKRTESYADSEGKDEMTNDTPRHPMVIVGAMRELNDMMLAATGTAYGWGRNDELLLELEAALGLQNGNGDSNGHRETIPVRLRALLQPGAFRDHARAVEEAPFVCEYCGRATNQLITSESADRRHQSRIAKRFKSIYRMALCPGHPRARQGLVFEHVLIAEQALGRYLSVKNHVHHVDGDGRNNSNSNLVICEGSGYHHLLHARMRIIAAGGDPDTEKRCGRCHQVMSRANFHRNTRSSDGLCVNCRACRNATHRTQYHEKMARVI